MKKNKISPRQSSFAVELAQLIVLGCLLLPSFALAQYTTIWSDGFNGNLANWTQNTGTTPNPGFDYSTTRNHATFTGAGAAKCTSGDSDQMFRSTGTRPFGACRASGYFWDDKGGFKTGTCGGGYRQALSIRDPAGATIIIDNGISANGATVYTWRLVGAGGAAANSTYANRNPATTCAGAFIYYETTVTPGAFGASPAATFIAKVTDGAGTTTTTQNIPNQTFFNAAVNAGIGRVTLGLGTSSTTLDSYWDDILFEAISPGAPTIGAATANSTTQITWTWTTADNNPFGFDIADSGGTIKSPQYPATSWVGRSSSWAETGLSPNTQYTRKVKAWNGSLDSAYSATVSKYTLATSPSAGSVTPDDSSPCPGSTVTWTAVGGFGAGTIQYYRYVWDQSPTHVWTDTETQWSSGTLATSLTSVGLWYLHVKSYNGDDVGSGTFDYVVPVLFTETMGTVGGTTTIAAHESANGFDNDNYTMSGSGDLRTTSASSGYAGASGGANVFITTTIGTFFQIADINTLGLGSLQLSFGIFKSTTASDGSDFIVEVSSDGTTYTPLSFAALPTSTGTAVWALRTATGTIPSTSNLRIRFRQTAATTQYRVDDIKLIASSTTPTITPSGSTTICSSDPVTLTASSGVSYLWSTSETTPSIVVSSSGNYTVTVTDALGCSSTSANQTVTASPAATVNAGPDQAICIDGTATLAGSIGGSATSATWSGGAGTFTPDNTTLNATYTPSAGEITAGTVTLTLTTDDPAGTCGAVADSVTITINKVTANTTTYTRNPGSPLKIHISDLLTNASDTLNQTITFVGVGTDGVNLLSTGGATLTTNATFIGYTDSVTPNVNDSITYKVTDTMGCVATGTIQINVSAGALGVVVIPTATGSGITLTFHGIPGYDYVVQRSDDLSTWVDASGILTAPADGVVQFTETPPNNPEYYRVRQN